MSLLELFPHVTPILLLKGALLGSSAIIWNRCAHNPNEVLTPEDKIQSEKYEPLLRSTGWSTVLARRAVENSFAIAASIELVATYFDKPSLPILNRLELAGYALLITGGLYRLYCMAYLGRFFTFNLTIRPNHQLITTGPYAVVRHPSYTGLELLLLGAGFIAFGSNFIRRVSGGVLESWVKVALGCIPAAGFWFGLGVERVQTEESMLSNAFGEEWKAYTKRTRYRLLPGLW